MTSSPAAPPSFDRDLGKWTWQAYQRINSGDTDPVLRLMVRKSAHHELLARVGAPHARLLHEVTTDTITPGHLAGPCTLKPDMGATGAGVFTLVPDTDGQWWDERAGRRYTWHDIGERMARTVASAANRPDEWLVEELVRPLDDQGLTEYGCYVFGGKTVPLVRAGRTHRGRTHRGRTSKRWFTPAGEPVVVEQPGWMFPVDDTIPAPPDMDQMLRLARRVAARVPTPFMRIDVFSSDRGLVVSEVNPTDGYRNGMVPGWDEVLGGLLAEATAATAHE